MPPRVPPGGSASARTKAATAHALNVAGNLVDAHPTVVVSLGVFSGLLCACCLIFACRVRARRNSRYGKGRYARAVDSELSDEDDDDEEEDDDDGDDDEFDDEFDDDEVEWNGKMAAMTGKANWKGTRGARWQEEEEERKPTKGSRKPSSKVAPAAGSAGAVPADLGMASLPAIFKTPDGACAVDVPLAGVRSVAALLDAIVELGSAMVDADIAADTIKVHYASGPGSRPRKLTEKTSQAELRQATGIIVTPGGSAASGEGDGPRLR